MKESKLAEPPTDCVSSLVFHPNNREILLSTSWDGSVRLYNVGAGNSDEQDQRQLVNSHNKHKGAAVLAGCFNQGVYLTFLVILFRWEIGMNAYELGHHEKPISCLDFNSSHRVVVSGSWDTTVRLWDRLAPNTQNAIAVLQQPERVYSISTQGDILVCALADRHFSVYDLRNIGHAVSHHITGGDEYLVERKRSMLKYPTRRVKLYPDNRGYVYGSIEGRVATEYFPTGENNYQNYAFKCHRQKADSSQTPGEQIDIVYPINALAFHPLYQTFLTGGSDGYVCLWDGTLRKRMKRYGPYPNGVNCLAFNLDGSLMAVGASYSFDQGEKQYRIPYIIYFIQF
ncbi:hypothetical protein BB560_002406 [Smittium megazygosporum]|uniref:Uncharacterized protein n=1 Tax=Smittium megazygosporum TaxID=133381 RepID=A0A2T9ZEW9_9FUNG|nr:hypothetical protein BB560_002406 [Smittium megazygosporum]